MTSKERFYACMNRKYPDRTPIAPLHGDGRVIPDLCEKLGVQSIDEFREKVGEDFRYVIPDYVGPKLKVLEDGGYEDIWGVHYHRNNVVGGFYWEPSFRPYEHIETLEEAKSIRIPSPDWYDYSVISDKIDKLQNKVIIIGSMGAFDFINGVSFMRGYEQTMLDIADENPIYLYLVERRFDFFYQVLERTLSAGKGKIDVTYVGDDLGSQLGPLISPSVFERLFAPKYKEAFKMIHEHGAKTMMHSCGAVRSFIPILIDIGLDILDVVHVDAVGMDLQGLFDDFHDKLTFCGTLSVQTFLNNAKPEEIIAEISWRKRLFRDGGLILGPSNMMQPDMPFENFLAMCKAIGCMEETY